MSAALVCNTRSRGQETWCTNAFLKHVPKCQSDLSLFLLCGVLKTLDICLPALFGDAFMQTWLSGKPRLWGCDVMDDDLHWCLFQTVFLTRSFFTLSQSSLPNLLRQDVTASDYSVSLEARRKIISMLCPYLVACCWRARGTYFGGVLSVAPCLRPEEAAKPLH